MDLLFLLNVLPLPVSEHIARKFPLKTYDTPKETVLDIRFTAC